MIEIANNIWSNTDITVTDLLCEGEIEGLVNGENSIYFNETPLVSNDGTRNFDKVNYTIRKGTVSQDKGSSFGTIRNLVDVGVKLDYNSSVVRTITDSDVNEFDVSLSLAQLQYIDQGSGDIRGNTVTVRVEYKPNGGAYTTVKDITLTGKSSSPLFVSLRDTAKLTGSAPWDIRVTRLTPGPTTQYDVNIVYFDRLTEIKNVGLSYPSTALIRLAWDAKTFQRDPTRIYDLKLLKIKIPDNYNPITGVYTGSWGGNFTTAWSNNPAWVYYDLLTNERYGLGSFITASHIDKWSLYTIGKYCDELVPDGFGGTEPRFTINCLINNRTDAYSLLTAVASAFRAMIYWGSGTSVATQDSPSDPVYLFTPANVIDGLFSYSSQSLRARHTAALVKWNDPKDFCKTKSEYVEDQDAINKYGFNQIELNAFGCTSRGQAHRMGKWALYTEQYESEIVTFKTGIDGIVSRPGQIIKIADPVKAGYRMGGRVSSATTTSIVLDDAPDTSVIGGTISIVLSTGAVEDRTITAISTNTVTVQPAFSIAPTAQTIWVIKNSSIEPQQFRVISVKEYENATFEISAVKHDPNKFAAIEQNLKFEEKDYSDLKQYTDPPKNVKITESLYQSGSVVKAKVSISWDATPFANSYLVMYKRDNENIVKLPETQFTDTEILDALPGNYSFIIQSINSFGKLSGKTNAEKEIFGKTAPPADVTGFSLIPNQGNAYISWNQSTDLDVLVGGQVRIRYTPLTTGQQWKNTIDIVPAVPGAATSAVVPLLEGTYMVKFVDSSGNYSVNASEIVTIDPQIYALNVVDTQTDSPSFNGDKYQMTFDADETALVLESLELVDDMPLIDDIGKWDFSGDIASEGTYTFENIVDLGSVYPATITANIEVEAFNNEYIWDSRGTVIDTWADIDGAEVNDVNAELFVRTTEDDPNATPTWTVWKRVHQGSYNARAFQYQLRATSGDPTHNLWIRQLEVTLDMKDRTVNLGPLSSGTGASYAVTYPDPFYATPSISVTSSAMATGDYFTITSESNTGFNIVFKNSGGTIVNRTFSVIAKGYGRKVA
jgi:predicted phage tail protein